MTASRITVNVAYASPVAETRVEVRLPAGATVEDAVTASGIVARLALDPNPLGCAIFGQRVSWATPIADGDRIELTRPLVADAKQVRRTRAADR
jgi:uncharacterized protein